MLAKEVKAGDGVVNVWWLILAQCNEEAGGGGSVWSVECYFSLSFP